MFPGILYITSQILFPAHRLVVMGGNVGVQAPMIYRLFGDKDGLLEAVAEHVMAAYVTAKTEIAEAASAAGIDPLTDLRAAWQTQIAFGVGNPSLFRLLSDPDRVRSSPAARAGREVLQARIHRVAATGRLRGSEQRATNLLHAAAIGAIQTLLATPPEDRDSGLPESMCDAVLGQIITNPPAPLPSDDDRIATAVTLRAMEPRLDALTPTEQQMLAEWLDRVIDRNARDRSAAAATP
jgi:AcrR family transcriptional regulator